MKTPRTLYWSVTMEDGSIIRGQKDSATCTINQYMGILQRKYRWQNVQRFCVGERPLDVD